ncbi:MAG: DUF2442 domain-containing protein [Ginsengibacter sp.]
MKNIIPQLKQVKALEGYKIFVEFNDGINGIIDLSKWKSNPAFVNWKIEENFKNFKITSDKKIDWGNNIEMDPDSFYLQLINKTFEEYAGDKQLLWHSH